MLEYLNIMITINDDDDDDDDDDDNKEQSSHHYKWFSGRSSEK